MSKNIFRGTGVKHAQFPEALIGLLPELSNSALCLYLRLLHGSHLAGKTVLQVAGDEIRDVGISRAKEALGKLEDAGLIAARHRKGHDAFYEITLLDAELGEPMPDSAGLRPEETTTFHREQYVKYRMMRYGGSVIGGDAVTAACPFHSDAELYVERLTGRWGCGAGCAGDNLASLEMALSDFKGEPCSEAVAWRKVSYVIRKSIRDSRIREQALGVRRSVKPQRNTRRAATTNSAPLAPHSEESTILLVSKRDAGRSVIGERSNTCTGTQILGGQEVLV